MCVCLLHLLTCAALEVHVQRCDVAATAASSYSVGYDKLVHETDANPPALL
jgi:hypothetical protein